MVWSQIELVRNVDEIQHPSARACLEYLGLNDVEIHYDGDLPGQSGLGSSSSFTVALLHALYALRGQMLTKERLATEAIHIEQAILHENVGSQDQVAAAYGGLNTIQFDAGGFQVAKLLVGPELLRDFQSHLTLFFVGQPRLASQVAAAQIAAIPYQLEHLQAMTELVSFGADSLLSGQFRAFGKYLDEQWKLKRRLSHLITNATVDAAYASALSAGAWGGSSWALAAAAFCSCFDRRRRPVMSAMRSRRSWK